MKSFKLISIFLFISFLAIGCGSGGGGTSTGGSDQNSIDISGNWSATFNGINVDCSGTNIYVINQDGNNLFGSITQSSVGSVCDDSPESFTGTINGNSVTLQCCSPKAIINLTLDESGNSMSGTISQSVGGFTGRATTELKRN